MFSMTAATTTIITATTTSECPWTFIVKHIEHMKWDRRRDRRRDASHIGGGQRSCDGREDEQGGSILLLLVNQSRS